MVYQRVLTIMISALALFAGAAQGQAVPPAPGSAPVTAGQSSTLLPDGRWLLAGGLNSQGAPSAAVVVFDPTNGTQTQVVPAMTSARAGHTATVLSDGSVLILGGIGIDGKVVGQAEVFHPETQTVALATSAPIARAFHTATLLPNGSLVIAGGIAGGGDLVPTIEIWDSRKQQSRLAAGQLADARRNQSAFLTSDGRIVFVGGRNQVGTEIKSAEVFDPASGTLLFLSRGLAAAQLSEATDSVSLTLPADGTANVAIDSLPAILFSKAVAVQDLAPSVTLNGPNGLVSATVVGAEGGRLAFINPTQPLAPATVYTVTLSGVVFQDGATLPLYNFSFTTMNVASPASFGAAPNGPDPFASKWRSLPPLQAPAGVTAISGQVLDLQGEPVHHLTLEIGEKKVKTDSTGRFLLGSIPSGHQVMVIDGRSASTRETEYGLYEYGADIKPGQTNVLPFTIWMTPLDMAHAVRLPSPTTKETIIKTPRLPGLELHLPAGTTIVDYDGRPATLLSVTPIPLKQPPFPLPHVQVPLYFTIQPGGAYIKVAKTSAYQGGRLFYPNTYNYPAGTIFSFWNYDADKKGWYVYGLGRVSADRTQVIPNPGVAVYELTGAMVSQPSNAPPNGPSPGNSNNNGGEPVDLGTGLFVYHKTDLDLQDVIPISLTRTYRQSDSVSRAFGIGTTHDYDIFLVGDNNTNPGGGYTYQDLVLSDGSRIHFTRISPCTGVDGFCDFGNAVYEHTTSPTEFYGAQIVWNGAGWTLTKKNGTVYTFADSDGSSVSQAAAVLTMVDRHGNSLIFTRDGNFNLTEISTPNGRWIKLTYDSSNRVTQALDSVGRSLSYSYDSTGHLSQVIDVNRGVTNYTYDSVGDMLTVQDPRGIFYLTNQYDANGRVATQTLADNTAFQFSYTVDQNTGEITQTNVTDPRGNVRQVLFSNGYTTSTTFAANDNANKQTTVYNRDPNTNLLMSMVDSMGRETDFTYDSMGNTTSVTRLAKTANAVTTSYQYEPKFNQVSLVTDPLGHQTQFNYDTAGNLTSVVDPMQQQTGYTYNSTGQVQSVTDPMLNVTQFTYDGVDLATVTDPNHNTSILFHDGAGRLAAATDPLGNLTEYQYDNLNQVTAVIDPAGGITSFTYDANGNVLTMQDPRQQGTTMQTSYVYDNRDRLISKFDPLERQTTYGYDAGGNLTSVTDGRGKTTTFQYDTLNRRSFVGYGTVFNGGVPSYESTVTFGYDTGNRLAKVTDSVGGVFTPQYDQLDRLTSKAAPQGTISYGYDNDNRQTSMTVTGQPQVVYTYDNDNRITQVTQASSNTTLSYDADNHRTAVTLPSGVSFNYGYDSGSRLTSISYQLGTVSLGNLAYGYDNANHRVQMSGTLAQTALPQPVTSASYDAANELTLWNGSVLSYDGAGNLTGDGVNTYAWNGRQQLASLSGGASASFLYGADGTRSQNASGVSFLYDGMNPVQELIGGTPSANLATGATDETWNRADGSGSYTPLLDALGSTVALVNSSGVLSTHYTYDPYGATTIAGGATSNPSQFTGRENDGTGLYYYRGRYYSPALHRFISEDPVGVRGGLNLYQYAGGDPVDISDPLGYWGTVAHNHLIEHALKPCGVSDDLIKQIEADSKEFDWQTGTGQDFANFHAMAKDGQDLVEAKTMIGNIILNQMDIAQLAMQDGSGSRDYAINQMAIGMHTMMDMTSPAHFTGPPDTGLPITWCSPAGCNLQQVHAHSWTDHDGIENSSDITPQIYDENDAMLRGAYEFVFGHPLSCKTQ